MYTLKEISSAFNFPVPVVYTVIFSKNGVKNIDVLPYQFCRKYQITVQRFEALRFANSQHHNGRYIINPKEPKRN